MFWGASAEMEHIKTMVERVAATDANVLITGENGTGKELLAREIHRLSARNGKEMVSLDMGAIPDTLFESELFGHKKGAFTDAHADRRTHRSSYGYSYTQTHAQADRCSYGRSYTQTDN